MSESGRSPAELLAEKKTWQRPPRNRSNYVRKTTWRVVVRELRESMRLSLDDVAKAVGLSKTCYWQIEQGVDLRVTSARRIATFFGKSIEELWTELLPKAREGRT